jgi:hypothetical protein
MKYDAKKTLTENIDELEEQNRGTAATAGTAVGAAAGAGAAAAGLLPGTAAVLAPGVAAVGSGGVIAGTGLAGLASSVGAALPGVAAGSTAAFLSGAAVLGGAAGIGLIPLAYWLITKDDGKSKVDRMFQYCSTDKNKIGKTKRGVTDNGIRDLSDKIYDAIEGLGTDEEAIYAAFGGLKTASDFCALVDRYNRDYGNLLDDLDSDIDDQSEWEKIYRRLRNCVEDTLISIKDEEKGKTIIKKVKGSTGPKFKDCTGTYTQGCKSDVIKKVQGCLNVKPDGLFGPKTQRALESKGFKNGFTDADVDKLCVANVVVQPTPPISQEDQYGYNTGNQQGQKPPFDSTVSNISVDKLDSI